MRETLDASLNLIRQRLQYLTPPTVSEAVNHRLFTERHALLRDMANAEPNANMIYPDQKNEQNEPVVAQAVGGEEHEGGIFDMDDEDYGEEN
jgi:hypothetical protein